MYEHSDGGYDLEPRADDEREEGTETHEDRLREVPAVVEQFPRHGADERPQDDAYGREDEKSGEYADREIGRASCRERVYLCV